jgi:hypothetical protein
MLAGLATTLPVALRGKFSVNRTAVLTAIVDQPRRYSDHPVRSATAG